MCRKLVPTPPAAAHCERMPKVAPLTGIGKRRRPILLPQTICYRCCEGPPMPIDYLISALVTLLVVVDPVGLTPAFISVTHGLPQIARRRIAIRASIIATGILAGTALIGDRLLNILG